MPREACEFCRRARVRHKTRRKSRVVSFNNQSLGFADQKYKNLKSRQKSSSMFVMRNKNKTTEIDKEGKFATNSKLQALVDLFKKEDEIEEVPSPEDSASTLSRSGNDVRIISNAFQTCILNDEKNKMSIDLNSVVKSPSAEKPSLEHFKIAEITFQQCANLLQSLSTSDQCIQSSFDNDVR